MKLQTKYFGEIDVNEKEIISFPQGIPGFVNEKEFLLLPLEDNSVFQVLQSASNVDPAFIVVNPFHFVTGYEFDLDQGTLELLEIESEKDVNVLSIVSLKDPFTTSTANLQAPVVINQAKRIGKQYITNLKDFTTKETLFTKQLTSQVKED
ncbi:flagellar assembly protein FliW [Aquibacillus koreensis]|uniref:Flagellar assembly factor FliW n=1 Tax=Aquibacillus koreensis TaxID=279446 RepID=A0A9X3WMQ7_9BACI|nr:flagellar assembly protein FliW [Aquibacillus koreensis]MCT2537255.1 flagellar assembly protein FliW [Aquibacillus koreensis]MDC3421603.1 flagellar assembly protein FliW [Aquibacillus koreensis]